MRPRAISMPKARRPLFRPRAKLAGAHTVIMISHRLSALEHADEIYVLEQENLRSMARMRSFLRKAAHMRSFGKSSPSLKPLRMVSLRRASRNSMRARPIRSFSPRSSSHHAGDEAASKATSSLELQHHGEACGPYAPASARYGAGDSFGRARFRCGDFPYGVCGVWPARCRRRVGCDSCGRGVRGGGGVRRGARSASLRRAAVQPLSRIQDSRARAR